VWAVAGTCGSWLELHWRREVYVALLRLYERLVVFGYLPQRRFLLEDYSTLEFEVRPSARLPLVASARCVCVRRTCSLRLPLVPARRPSSTDARRKLVQWPALCR
jgi:hypothetical protein